MKMFQVLWTRGCSLFSIALKHSYIMMGVIMVAARVRAGGMVDACTIWSISRLKTNAAQNTRVVFKNIHSFCVILYTRISVATLLYSGCCAVLGRFIASLGSPTPSQQKTQFLQHYLNRLWNFPQLQKRKYLCINIERFNLSDDADKLLMDWG